MEASTGIKTVWLYDGVTLPTVRPLLIVEQMQNNNALISKQRRVETTYRYQIGLYAATIRERSLLQDEVKKALREKIELISATTPGEKLGYFYALVTGETPITPDDSSDKSKYHRVYFDVEVSATN
ncbi:hypothetical protein [Cytobacillus purgationiresistens]|uniref:Uncharacterized protein n=1 Tax=Cytobacillus purgationiresistens TaxID=863449 RepID=A0ABU0AJZ1_9BACI|nr:hypothetical protein [Cytobacillus purgationiresistens]MDQ0270723.1 hypothetical protein [Cytobacillus purgationiresistens]